jgi:hypothetical protein
VIEEAIKELEKEGLEIELFGPLRKKFILEMEIGGKKLECIISTALEPFASIPSKEFKGLEKRGEIRGVRKARFLLPFYMGGLGNYKVGRADIRIRGEIGQKDYENVSIVANPTNHAYLGQEFVESFEVSIFGFKVDYPLVGFFGCKRK